MIRPTWFLALFVAISLLGKFATPTYAQEFSEQEIVDIVNAVNEDDVKKVESMLKAKPELVKAKFNSGGPVSGWPLVMIAANNGNKPMVDVFIKYKADVNDRNLSNETALHYAAGKGHKAIVQTLIKNKADVNAKNDVDATPLSVAAAGGHKEIIAMLKKAGAKE